MVSLPRLEVLLSISTLLISSLACATIMGEGGIDSPSPFITEMPAEEPTEAPVFCSDITNQIIESNFYTSEESENEIMDFGGREERNETYIVTYLVTGDEISDPFYEDVPSDLQDEQDDSNTHEAIWDYFAGLIPMEFRGDLSEFSIMTDGEGNALAAVAQTYDDPALWILEVDIADSQDRDYLSFTLIHEFAHLLTLNSNQVSPSEAIFNNPEDNDIYLEEVSSCPNFFPGEGCADENSYINEFYNQFWMEIYDDWNEINLEEDDENYYNRLDEFYSSHQDQFLTDYSVTHPAEDIAETFSFFVLSQQPAGENIAEQKILFFYQYPELIELRSQILNNLCRIFPE